MKDYWDNTKWQWWLNTPYRNQETGHIICPKCGCAFINRKKGKYCPNCHTRLVLPPDTKKFSVYEDGYYWNVDQWLPIHSLR